MHLPARLRHHRRQAGLTQRQLADRSLVSRRTIARIEAGYIPQSSTVRLLAIALSVDEDELTSNEPLPEGDEEAA